MKRLNKHAEEKQRKDVRKRLREEREVSAEEPLHCDFPECGFIAVSKAGLVNKSMHNASLFSASSAASPSDSRGCTIINASVLADLVELEFLACTTP